MQESIVFLVRVQCGREERSRLLSHLLMSFLSYPQVRATATQMILLRDLLRIKH